MSRFAVLPVLHLNGYKIANPTILARIPHEELESLLIGYGHKPYFVEGDDPLRAEFSTSQTGESVQFCRGSKSFWPILEP